LWIKRCCSGLSTPERRMRHRWACSHQCVTPKISNRRACSHQCVHAHLLRVGTSDSADGIQIRERCALEQLHGENTPRGVLVVDVRARGHRTHVGAVQERAELCDVCRLFREVHLLHTHMQLPCTHAPAHSRISAHIQALHRALAAPMYGACRQATSARGVHR
jgi:hypothetical protein